MRVTLRSLVRLFRTPGSAGATPDNRRSYLNRLCHTPMPLDTFKTRIADNVEGKFYVGDQCWVCDNCLHFAPANFERNDAGDSYVKKQPETPEELAACREAMESCCTGTIFEDGDSFDWAAIPAPAPYDLTPEGQVQRAQWLKQETPHDCCKPKRDDKEGEA